MSREIYWMFIMVWNGCVERLFMFTDCLWIVMDNSSTKSLKHLALDWTFGEYGTRIREKVWCRRCRVHIFATEISRSSRIETYELRDLGNVMISIDYSSSRYCVFPSETRECIAPES
jgi:hypothetical protein